MLVLLNDICLLNGEKLFRLNSRNYQDLRAKLRAPVQAARDIIVHQSLSERFVEAFLQQTAQNPKFPMPEEQKQVKLV